MMDKPLLKPAQVAVLLNISESYVYKLANDGALPSVRFSIPTEGKRAKSTLRFKEADIKNFIADSYSLT